MAQTDNQAEVGLHIFERAGLGKAPYRFMGCNENRFPLGDGTFKPGGCCDYCANGILFEMCLRSADGREFKVGSSCIDKAGDRGLIRAYKSAPAMRQHARELRRAKDVRITETLDAFIADHTDQLKALPHPYKYAALNAYDYAVWMRQHSGASGRAKTLKTLQGLL